MSAVIVSLSAYRPKSAFVQFLNAGCKRSQAAALADHVRHAVKQNGESRQHAIDRLLNPSRVEVPKEIA